VNLQSCELAMDRPVYAFVVTQPENRCKLALNEFIALFPTVEIFRAIGVMES
jgi:hypothetical protein